MDRAVEVQNLPANTDVNIKEVLLLFFGSPRNGGYNIECVCINSYRNAALLNFTDDVVNEVLKKKSYNILGKICPVRIPCIAAWQKNTLFVTGFPETMESFKFELYFESKKVSNNAELLHVNFDQNNTLAYITFKDPEAAEFVMNNSPHVLEGQLLVVEGPVWDPFAKPPEPDDREKLDSASNESEGTTGWDSSKISDDTSATREIYKWSQDGKMADEKAITNISPEQNGGKISVVDEMVAGINNEDFGETKAYKMKPNLSIVQNKSVTECTDKYATEDARTTSIEQGRKEVILSVDAMVNMRLLPKGLGKKWMTDIQKYAEITTFEEGRNYVMTGPWNEVAKARQLLMQWLQKHDQNDQVTDDKPPKETHKRKSWDYMDNENLGNTEPKEKIQRKDMVLAKEPETSQHVKDGDGCDSTGDNIHNLLGEMKISDSRHVQETEKDGNEYTDIKPEIRMHKSQSHKERTSSGSSSSAESFVVINSSELSDKDPMSDMNAHAFKENNLLKSLNNWKDQKNNHKDVTRELRETGYDTDQSRTEESRSVRHQSPAKETSLRHMQDSYLNANRTEELAAAMMITERAGSQERLNQNIRSDVDENLIAAERASQERVPRNMRSVVDEDLIAAEMAVTKDRVHRNIRSDVDDEIIAAERAGVGHSQEYNSGTIKGRSTKQWSNSKDDKEKSDGTPVDEMLTAETVVGATGSWLDKSDNEKNTRRVISKEKSSISRIGLPNSATTVQLHNGTVIHIYTGDITKLKTDGIVNAANEGLNHAGGVAGAIARAAGHALEKDSQEYIQKNSFLPIGEAMSTSAGNLANMFVIHTVGPRWDGGLDKSRCERDLTNAITRCIMEAHALKLSSLAIPAISSGNFGVPMDTVKLCFIDALMNFDMKYFKDSRLKEIHLVNIEQNTTQLLQDYFIRIFKNKKRDSSDSHQMRGSRHGSHSSSVRDLDKSPDRQGHSYADMVKGSPPMNNEDAMEWEDGYSATGSSYQKKDNNIPEISHQNKDDKSKSKEKDSEEKDSCVICMSEPENPKVLPQCKHTFCKDCIDACFKKMGPKCPVCNTMYGRVTGSQPMGGKMSVEKRRHIKLEGFQCGTIQIDYSIPGGIQEKHHPTPGQYYNGINRRAYLPDNAEGNKVLKLLRRAFDDGHIFTIGRSTTTGADGVVTWNDIHHKTNMSGGPSRYGYPDSNYLKRVQDELAAKGYKE